MTPAATIAADTTAATTADGQREADRIALVDALNLPTETTWTDALNSAALLPAALAESRSAEEYHRLVAALLCTPTEAPLASPDPNDARVAVRSTLVVMAIKLMAAAVRANPNARNYGAWRVGANPDADPKAEPGSPEDIEGWDIHVACVRPGAKGPADLVAEKVEEIDRLRVELAEAQATIANERGEGEAPIPGFHWSLGRRAWVYQPWLMVPKEKGPERVVRLGPLGWELYLDGLRTREEYQSARAAMADSATAAAKGGE